MLARDSLQQQMEAVFLREIAHSPGDETPLLIYADWLTDLDDLASVSRGEFLRLESILKRGRPGADRADLEWQARQLWWDHVESWLGPLYHAIDHFHYERGLLSVEVSDITLAGVTADDLLDAPAWNWVRHIGVRRGGIEALALLSELPRPALLSSIDVGRKTISDVEEDLPALLDCSILDEIEALDLSDNRLVDAGCVELARWDGLRSLRRLTLSKTILGSPGVQALLSSAKLESLEELTLSHDFIEAEGARELCETSALPALTRLDVTYNPLDWHSIAALQQRFGGAVEWYPARMAFGG